MTPFIVIPVLLAAIVMCLHKAGLINLGSIVADLRAAAQPYAPKRLLTDNEMHFFRVLQRACPDHLVLPQVGMGAIVKVRGAEGRAAFSAARNRFSSKLVDFVVCRPSNLEVVCLVELDDRTHDPERDAKRDAITRAAGYRTLRFDSKAKPDAATLRTAIFGAQSGISSGAPFAGYQRR